MTNKKYIFFVSSLNVSINIFQIHCLNLSANSWRMSGIESNTSIVLSNTFQRVTITSPIISIVISTIDFAIFQILMMFSFICICRSSFTSRLLFAMNLSSVLSKRDNNFFFNSRSFPSIVARKFNFTLIDQTTNSFDGCVHVMLLYCEKKRKKANI